MNVWIIEVHFDRAMIFLEDLSRTGDITQLKSPGKIIGCEMNIRDTQQKSKSRIIIIGSVNICKGQGGREKCS